MPEEFQLITEFPGYMTKPDKTEAPTGALVSGSQNVLIVDRKKVETRGGYTMYGAVSADTYAIESSYDWEMSDGTVRHLRSFDEELQFYDPNADAWTKLSDGFSAVDFYFAGGYWDTTEGIDLLLFVNGSDCIWDWSGAVTTLASATTNSITKSGTSTWAEERFLTTGTRQVIINGTTYTYTGGEGTTTLTGVTPSPVSEAAGSTVFQAIRLNDDEPANGTENDVIAVHKGYNQVFVGTKQQAYISANDDFTDYTYSSPRAHGEGDLLQMGSKVRGFVIVQGKMMISGGRDNWYLHSFYELDVSGLKELSRVVPLQVKAEQAAQGQDLICGKCYLSFEPALREIVGIDENNNLITENLSDPIKPDFDDETFTGGHLKFHKNRYYLSAPTNDKVYILQIDDTPEGQIRYWQPPQILPISKFAIVSGLIYGHGYRTPETYKLFDGTSDRYVDGDTKNSFKAVANFAYLNGGDDKNLKVFDEHIVKGYISPNTTDLKATIKFDFEGAESELEKEINGSDEDILFQPAYGAGLGDEGLGDAPLGDQEEEAVANPRFRTLLETAPQDFHEYQLCFETDGLDRYWAITALGSNMRYSVNKPINIKK